VTRLFINILTHWFNIACPMADHSYLASAMEDLFREDGLCVMARGCGINKLLAKFVQYYSYGTSESHLSQEESKKLVFVLNLSGQEQLILDHLLADGIPPHRLPRIITSENVTAQERYDLFARGGCFIITSRLLIVDLLDHKVSVESILGMLVANAHRVTETSLETFILRVYRERQRAGFVKAFSEDPEGLTGTFAKVDRTMKLLWLQKLYLWPRFHEAIVKSLDSSQPEVIEILQPLSDSMKTMQSAILVALSTVINELKKAAPTLETGYMTLENGLFSAFDHVVRSQLEPEWHRISTRTKQLVADLRSLRGLLDYLIRYDSLTFYYHLLRLRADSIARDSFSPSLWLSSDAAEVVFRTARDRVFRVGAVKLAPAAAPAITTDVDAADAADGTVALDDYARQLAAAAGLETRMRSSMECPPKWKLLLSTVLKEVRAAYEKRQGELEAYRSRVRQAPRAKSAAQSDDTLENGEGEKEEDGGEGEKEEIICEEPSNGGVLLLFKDADTLIRVRDCLVHGPSQILDERYRWFIAQSAGEIRGKLAQAASGNSGKSSGGGGKWNHVERRTSAFDLGPTRPAPAAGAATSEVKREDAKVAAKINVSHSNNTDASALGVDIKDTFGVTAAQLASLSADNRMMLLEDAVITRMHGIRAQQAQVVERQQLGKQGHMGSRKRPRAVPTGVAGKNSTLTEQKAVPVPAQWKSSKKSSRADPAVGSVDEGGYASDSSTDSDALCGYEVREELHLTLLTHQQAAERADVLGELDPFAVILYDPDVSLVRRIEVFQAQKQQEYEDRRQVWRQGGRRGHTYPAQQRTKVYFLMYNTSVEEHRYVSALAREKKAFESLVISKGKMAVCLPDLPQDILALRTAEQSYSVDSRTVHRGSNAAAAAANKQKRIVADVREFRCPLPSLLHAVGIALTARSITVGDYILAPEICVERKSISDLIGSFQSGRLYNQSEAMARYYKYPCLLIEFSEQQSFCFHSSDELPDDIRGDSIQTRLVTLAIAFPGMRNLWARSTYCTPDIFKAITVGHEPVDEAKALAAGSAGAAGDGISGVAGVDEQEARTASHEMLLTLPGINAHNVRTVIEEVESLADLACRSELDLANIVGAVNAKLLFAFLQQK